MVSRSSPRLAGEQRAECEHCSEQPRLVDAQRADHLAVLRGRADQRAPARARQQQPQEAEHRGSDHDQQQVVAGELPPEDLHRAREPRRARAEHVFRPPEPQRRVLDDEHQREGRQQLEELGRAVDAPQQRHLDQRAEGPHRECREQQRRPEPPPAAQPLRQRVGDVDAQHEERAVREVHDARHAEDQRQARGHEEQRRGAGQAVEELDDEAGEGHSGTLPCRWGWSAAEPR
jgi:hypothetical protein